MPAWYAAPTHIHYGRRDTDGWPLTQAGRRRMRSRRGRHSSATRLSPRRGAVLLQLNLMQFRIV